MGLVLPALPCTCPLGMGVLGPEPCPGFTQPLLTITILSLVKNVASAQRWVVVPTAPKSFLLQLLRLRDVWLLQERKVKFVLQNLQAVTGPVYILSFSQPCEIPPDLLLYISQD